MSFEEITFKADKKHRDKYFSAGSFAHPAKMMLPLQRWLIERYSKPGEVILDPMAGQGTLLIACTTGRHVIMVELESKFVQMQNDNWTKIQTLGPEMGYSMGTATILQGDARKLPDVLADVVITSPPYGIPATSQESSRNEIERRIRKGIKGAVITEQGECMTGDGKRQQRYSEDPNNIGNLPYGKLADVIMTSPPYAEAQSGGGIAQKGYQGSKHSPTDLVGKRSYMPEQAGQADGQISSLPYGSIDAVITSPPYENQIHKGTGEWSQSGEGKLLGGEQTSGGKMLGVPQGEDYIKSSGNIGNLKGESYLSAMLEVYQGCWRVLKPQGLMVLVTKNFIRNKQEIRLDLDTIKLCEQAGFELIERHYRKLTSQSFWRTIYRQKYPDAPILDKEDILVFRKLL